MALDESNDLPQHYGSKTSNGEFIQRLPSPSIPSSPLRAYQPSSRRDYSPERTPMDFHFGAEHSRSGGSGGLRRRASSNAPHRYSLGEYDRDRPSMSSGEHSKRPLRLKDDGYYREDDRHYPRRDDWAHHPDSYERSRPPRAFRNVDAGERGPPRLTFDEGRGDYRERDLERGDYPDAKQESTSSENFVASVGEFVGTTMFLFFAFAGTQVANIQSTASSDNASTSGTTSGGATGFNISVYLYIALIFGFSLMVNVWVFFRISGGLFNPAVTLGMVLVGAVPIVRAICLFCAQISGSVAASAMVLGLFPTQFNVRTTLAGGTSLVQGIFIEALLTAELVFTIFMLAKEKHKATFIAPVGIGLALFIAEIVGVYYTGGSLNPARSFGPCVVTATFDPEHWIYWLGPFIGTCIAVFFYKFIKMLEYEMANPGQDGDDKNDPTKNEEKKHEVQARSRSIFT
ncbi:Aquaporin-1 [Lachnellula hyalina]|uniref:Aquaporin-1 n=1 Tax=Lachnellula hyalina TaxID=1316788 RepID=A0A8H8TYI7_9HELO|nr:Aquaporin-1 [Lachnellula hyalina]TVY26682.1 Aquaporin-1 [Lachnellula hyalina]